MAKKRLVILGAAGRDFHVFNTVYRDDAETKVVAFTATQIPEIAGRRYPVELSGPHYPEGIPILAEEELEHVIADQAIDEAVFAYSDVSFEHVGQIASRVLSAGARFVLLDRESAIPSDLPVISVCAIRTGCGKSQTSRFIAGTLRDMGKRVAVIRHPMPYGDLAKQAVQEFRSVEDMEAADCTIEEREEYEHYVALGFTVFAGVDYAAILDRASKNADVILWDGGNNDTSFYRSDLHVVVLDPLRAGHETSYHPGMVNLLSADFFVINKVDQATPDQIAAVEGAAAKWNPGAEITKARSELIVSDPDAVRGRRVLCVEDGPTLTHGQMSIGAAYVAATRLNATVVDPRPFAVGSIRATYDKYAHLGPVLPALGYFPEQLQELEKTIAAADVDTVLVGTPIDLSSLLKIEQPVTRVSYRLHESDGEALAERVRKVFA